MNHDPGVSYTAFAASRRIASGSLAQVAVSLRGRSSSTMPLVFDDGTGAQVELDLRGAEAEVAARYGGAGAVAAAEAPPPRGRGRPRLGVVSREVTLLPQQWDWLSAQPGGASVALRKLVHAAMRAGGERERLRRAQERSYKVMVALAGDRPGFEEAARALFAADTGRLVRLVQSWPADVRDYVLRLASPDESAQEN
jgi:hypothetical protein